MSIRDKQDIQKTLDVAREFVSRCETVLDSHEKVQEVIDNGNWSDYPPLTMHTTALNRQSMELTRQLAILRRA